MTDVYPPGGREEPGAEEQKSRGGAPRGNQNRTASGRFKSTTASGRVRHTDEFDREGVKYARNLWRRFAWPKSPLKNVLAAKQGVILRLKAAVGKNSPTNREGEMRDAWRTLMQVTNERDRLLERLETRWQGQAKSDDPGFRICSFGDSVGRTIAFRSGEIGDPLYERACRQVEEEGDRMTATMALEDAGLPATDEAVRIFWLGRLWSPHVEGEEQHARLFAEQEARDAGRAVPCATSDPNETETPGNDPAAPEPASGALHDTYEPPRRRPAPDQPTQKWLDHMQETER